MRILGLDSSQATISVALLNQGQTQFCKIDDQRAPHSQALALLMQEGLETLGIAPCDIDALAVSCGPGSFTGVRVGCATAMGFAMALGIPVCAVDALLALSLQAQDNNPAWEGPICAMMDARADRIYAGIYSAPHCQMAPAATTIGELLPKLGQQRLLFTGDGAQKHAEVLKEYGQVDANTCLSAEYVARWAHDNAHCFAPAEQLKALYLTPPQAVRARP